MARRLAKKTTIHTVSHRGLEVLLRRLTDALGDGATLHLRDDGGIIAAGPNLASGPWRFEIVREQARYASGRPEQGLMLRLSSPTRRFADMLGVAFADGLGDLAATLHLEGSPVPESMIDEAREAGRRFAAAQRWAQLTGDRVDTATLRALLGISRQAISQRAAAGTLIAVPGSGTSWYPTWQFRTVDGTDRLEVRPVIAALVQAFRDELGDQLDPLTLVGWAASPQPELDDQAPREWIAAERDPDAAVLAAKRAAAELAR